jgi:hypothetical protein
MSTSTTIGLRSQPNLALTVPLLSSSLTVFYAIMETTVFYCFQQSAKRDPRATAKVTRLWWSAFLPPGVSIAFAVIVPGIVGGAYALRFLERGSLQWNLCAAGAAFNLGHFAFGPTIANIIKNICDEGVEKQGKTMEYIRKWLVVHFWRTLFADLPALVCFLYAAFGTTGHQTK